MKVRGAIQTVGGYDHDVVPKGCSATAMKGNTRTFYERVQPGKVQLQCPRLSKDQFGTYATFNCNSKINAWPLGQKTVSLSCTPLGGKFVAVGLKAGQLTKTCSTNHLRLDC